MVTTKVEIRLRLSANRSLKNYWALGRLLWHDVFRFPTSDESDSSSTSRILIAVVQQHAVTRDTIVDLLERESCSGQVLARQSGIPLQDTGFPPHDFIATASRAIWLTCPAAGTLLPFLLGQKGPAECLSFRQGVTSTLFLLERRRYTETEHNLNDDSPPRPIHPVHFGCA